jgi:hypothetical protein
LLKHGGAIIDIKPILAKLIRSTLPGPFHVMIATARVEVLEQVARTAEHGALRQPIARTVPLSAAITALTELQRKAPPKVANSSSRTNSDYQRSV